MKKVKYGYIEDFKPVVLYLDDLEKILEILKELSDKIRISTDEYELDSLDELHKIGQETLNTLIIEVGGSKGSFPDISLNFRPSDISFHVYQDTLPIRGVLEKTKEFLNGRKRKLYFLATLFFWFSFGAIGYSICFLLDGPFTFNRALIGFAIIFLGLICIWWNHQVTNKKWSVIHLKRRVDLPSFWKRNKDRIIIAIITIIFTTICNWIVFNLLKRP